MKPKRLVLLGIYIAVASLLLSCSGNSPVVPVTGNESMAVPNMVASARDLASTHIQEKYSIHQEKGIVPALPSMDTWQANVNARPDLVDMSFYSFTSGDWLVTVREPENMTGPLSITYINTQTGFVWYGFVDRDGNVVDYEYIR
jgi:hypothetical protein